MNISYVKIFVAVFVVCACSARAMIEPKTPHKGNEPEERQETGNKNNR